MIHPSQTLERLEIKVADAILRYLERQSRISASKLHFHANKDGHEPSGVIRQYQTSDTCAHASEDHPLKTKSLKLRKVFAPLKHDSLTPLNHPYGLDYSVPSAIEHPLKTQSLNMKKILAQRKHYSLTPLIRTYILENSFLPVQSQSESTQAAHKPHVLEEAKMTKVFMDFGIARKVIPRKLTEDSSLCRAWPPECELLRDATEVTSEAPGEDEPSFDELGSLLDELQVLVSDTPDVTTKTEFSLSNPHSSPRYPARPPASSWNPTLTRQSLEHSKMSFSTWSSKATRRHYATAAVSDN